MTRLLKPEEVADRLAISPKMVRAWLREGKLPGIRLGRLWRVDPEALERFLRGELRAETPPKPPAGESKRETKRTPSRGTRTPEKRAYSASEDDDEKARAADLRRRGFKVACIPTKRRKGDSPR